jgi:hypothetical protein
MIHHTSRRPATHPLIWKTGSPSCAAPVTGKPSSGFTASSGPAASWFVRYLFPLKVKRRPTLGVLGEGSHICGEPGYVRSAQDSTRRSICSRHKALTELLALWSRAGLARKA